jgi:hypothetical protein
VNEMQLKPFVYGSKADRLYVPDKLPIALRIDRLKMLIEYYSRWANGLGQQIQDRKERGLKTKHKMHMNVQTIRDTIIFLQAYLSILEAAKQPEQ